MRIAVRCLTVRRIVCLTILLLTIPERHADARDGITIKGSDTMVVLNRELAEAYGALHPEMTMTVFGRGSESGIRALMNGDTDIAAASRRMKASELAAFEERHGAPPEEVVIALDGIGVYVHNNNAVSRLTVAQLAGILSGEIRNWREVGGIDRRIDIYNRDKNSGTRTFMRDRVLQGRGFSNLARDVSSTSLLTAAVARNQSAIGYGGIAYSRGAHIIKVSPSIGQEAVWPSFENVSNGKYPLSRPLYYYLHPRQVDSALRSYVDWVLSEAGQEVVTFVGFYPAPGREAPDRTDEAIAAPVLGMAPVRLSPSNAAEHGFEVDVTVIDTTSARRPGQIAIQVAFDPRGHTIQRIRSLSIHIGEEIELPVELDRDLKLQFKLRRQLLDGTSIYLAEAGAPEDGAIFVLPLGAFAP